MCVCVCVCVYIYIYIYTYIGFSENACLSVDFPSLTWLVSGVIETRTF